MGGLEAIFRWLHVFAGITWIGHLYFFNWVNGPLQAKLDGPTKKLVVPELMPRALYWFRWGAAYTWLTGFLMLVENPFQGGNNAWAVGIIPGSIGIALLLTSFIVRPRGPGGS